MREGTKTANKTRVLIATAYLRGIKDCPTIPAPSDVLHCLGNRSLKTCEYVHDVHACKNLAGLFDEIGGPRGHRGVNTLHDSPYSGADIPTMLGTEHSLWTKTLSKIITNEPNKDTPYAHRLLRAGCAGELGKDGVIVRGWMKDLFEKHSGRGDGAAVIRDVKPEAFSVLRIFRIIADLCLDNTDDLESDERVRHVIMDQLLVVAMHISDLNILQHIFGTVKVFLGRKHTLSEEIQSRAITVVEQVFQKVLGHESSERLQEALAIFLRDEMLRRPIRLHPRLVIESAERLRRRKAGVTKHIEKILVDVSRAGPAIW